MEGAPSWLCPRDRAIRQAQTRMADAELVRALPSVDPDIAIVEGDPEADDELIAALRRGSTASLRSLRLPLAAHSAPEGAWDIFFRDGIARTRALVFAPPRVSVLSVNLDVAAALAACIADRLARTTTPRRPPLSMPAAVGAHLLRGSHSTAAAQRAASRALLPLVASYGAGCTVLGARMRWFAYLLLEGDEVDLAASCHFVSAVLAPEADRPSRMAASRSVQDILKHGRIWVPLEKAVAAAMAANDAHFKTDEPPLVVQTAGRLAASIRRTASEGSEILCAADSGHLERRAVHYWDGSRLARPWDSSLKKTARYACVDVTLVREAHALRPCAPASNHPHPAP